MTAYEPSLALRSTHELSLVWGNSTMSAHKCSWFYVSMLMNAHERLFVILVPWHHAKRGAGCS